VTSAIASMPFENIADGLTEMARRRPQAMAVAVPQGSTRVGKMAYAHLSYEQLDARSSRVARALSHRGIAAGARTVLMAPPSLDFFVLVFALFKARATMVCIDPGLGIANLGRCLAEAAPVAFIGVPKAHLARRLFRWGSGTLRENIVLGARRGWGLGTPLARLEAEAIAGGAGKDNALPLSPAEVSSTDAAAILFTSGSTGAPKGVVYTHANFIAQLEALQAAFDIQVGEVDLATFPLFALYAPALGMTAIVPEMDFTRPAHADPRKLARAIEQFGVTNLFGSPALLDRFGSWAAERQARFPSLRRVVSAGAPVPARVIERVTSALSPGVQVFTPYGATESLPVAVIGSDEILRDTRMLTAQGRGVCVGRPVPSIQVRIIRITDAPIDHFDRAIELPPKQAAQPLGEVGEIIVSGPQVTASYDRRPDATAAAKIADPQMPNGFWHRMGDLGYFDEQGRLWFCGRKSQRVQTAEGDLYTVACEGVFNAHPCVKRTALVGIGRCGAQRPVICIELFGGEKASGALRDEIAALGEPFEHMGVIRDFLFHPAFPVDIRHNAKIGREQLAVWAAGKLR
jgi:acyl-CoA synthetase (AMP-forming)/AMP-acid ligase II